MEGAERTHRTVAAERGEPVLVLEPELAPEPELVKRRGVVRCKRIYSMLDQRFDATKLYLDRRSIIRERESESVQLGRGKIEERR